jgi:uncharacterized protein YifN (PemK superfamily)
MEVIFKDTDEKTLGLIKHTDFVETMIPAFKPDAHDMFLKHVFRSKKQVKNWQIKDLIINHTTAIFSLSEAESPLSVADFSKSQNKQAHHYLKPYNIVEVDFGFYSDLFCIDGTVKKNSKSHGGLLSGEMHKRRPCVVLGVDRNNVQVIPLSTREVLGHNPLCIPLDKSSFEKLAQRYRNKTSYALLGMIQSVSVCRVFPPRNIHSKYEHKYLRYKVSSSDKASIKKSLAEQYNQDVTTKLCSVQRQLDKVNQERGKLLSFQTQILKEKKELEQFILTFGTDVGAGGTLEEIMGYYKQ